MAYHLGASKPEDLAKALGQALDQKNALAETTHASMGYSGGSPTKAKDERMAGNILGGHLGLNGEFANAIRDPQGMANLEAFEELLYNGPFSPLPPPIV